MLRAPKTQMSFYIALILVALGAVSAIPLLSAAIVEGRPLTAFEDIILDLLIGCFVFAGPAGLMLWSQWRRRDEYQQTINEEKRKLAQLNAALNNMAHGLCLYDAEGSLAGGRLPNLRRQGPEGFADPHDYFIAGSN